jgi:hypothetical protein
VNAAPSGGLRRWWLRAATGLLFAALAFFLSYLGGLEDTDESWFMQVTQRVASGETLYRDVYFNSTPLPVYLTVAFAKLFGNELLVHKALLALLSALILQLLWLIADQYAAPRLTSQCLPAQPSISPMRGAPLLLLLGMFVYGIPWKVTTTPLATVFFLACQAATLAYLGTERQTNGPGSVRSHAYLALAGAAAGLSFCSKQNYGVAALVALLACAVLGSRSAPGRRRLLPLALILFAFATVTILVHVPVYVSGGVEGLIDYGFASKTQYVRFAGLSLFDGLQTLWTASRLLFSSPPLWMHLQNTYWTIPFLLPFVAFPSLALACLAGRKDRREIAIAATLFAGAGFLGVFPRCDQIHLAFVVPHLLLALSYASQSVPRSWPGGSSSSSWRLACHVVVFVWLGAGLGLKVIQPTLPLLSGRRSLSVLPHYRGTPVKTARDLSRKSDADALARLAGGKPLFLLSPRAGFLYLTSGVRNPTPFDYPIITGLGLDGERRFIQAISRGDIDVVGVDQAWLPGLRPSLLIGHIRNNFTKTDDVGLVTLYRRRP